MSKPKTKYDNAKGVCVAGWMDHDTHRALKKLAEEESRTLNGQINHMLKQALKSKPTKRRAVQAAE